MALDSFYGTTWSLDPIQEFLQNPLESRGFAGVELWPPNVGMCQADKAKGPEVHHPDFFATQLMSAVCAGGKDGADG